ncbi:MAG: creatininase family protein [Acidimicrobiales bacterium]
MGRPRLEELTSPEVAAAMAERPLAIVPCGSTEQHGPHLPTGTDYYASLALAERVASETGGVVLSGLQFGVTPIHAGFPGTVSLAPETYQAVLYEMVASVASHGALEAVFVNWHEGNIPSLAIVGARLTRELGLSVVLAHACYVAEELYGEKLGGLTHGGAIEAGAVLAVRPDLVHYDRLGPADDSPGERTEDKARRGKAFQSVLRDIREIAPAGWYGSSERMSPDDASEMMDAVAAVVAREVSSRLAHLGRLRSAAR